LSAILHTHRIDSMVIQLSCKRKSLQ
jgi:hypothetical protein